MTVFSKDKRSIECYGFSDGLYKENRSIDCYGFRDGCAKGEEEINGRLQELAEIRLPDDRRMAKWVNELKVAEYIRLKTLLTEIKQAEYVRLEKLKEIQRLIAKLDGKGTLRKYLGFIVKEKTHEQERPTHPPYLKVSFDNSSSPTPTSEQLESEYLAKLLEVLEQYDLKYASETDNDQERPTDPPSLSEIMSSIPGVKFQPNDDEIFFHLKKKSSSPCQTPSCILIKDCADLYGTEPRHLPGANSIRGMKELYFYVLTKKKSGNGDRIGPKGFWRAGSSKILFETVSEIGYRRTLKYFEYPNDKNHKSSKYKKPTNWIMHEYRLVSTSSQFQEESFEHWTICKITWTGKNVEGPHEFSIEGLLGPSEMAMQQNSSFVAQKYLDNNELKMHIQNEGDLKVSEIVDSKQDETAQANYHSIVDEFGRSTQKLRGKLREQRMNREIHQFEEVTPCYASGIHSTPTIMVTANEVETEGVEPQQFENPGKITEEFGPSISGQTTASWVDWFLNQDFIGREDENQSQFDPSISEQTIASWVDCFLKSDSIKS